MASFDLKSGYHHVDVPSTIVSIWGSIGGEAFTHL